VKILMLINLIAFLGPNVLLAKNSLTEDKTIVERFYEQIIPKLRPKIRQYSGALEALLDNIYDRNSDKTVPQFVHQKVKEIFTGKLANIQEWNERLFNQGLRAHYTAYILQDFRNSEVAGTISDFYTGLNPENKTAFEDKLREEISDPIVYEFMFRLGLRPFVFTPWEVPEYEAEAYKPDWRNAPEKIWRVENADGGLIFDGTEERGIDENGSVVINWEASFSYVCDPKNRSELIAYIYYFQNYQPSFSFLCDCDHPHGRDFFKTYLGSKGNFLWYNRDEETHDNFGFPLTEIQVKLLHEFFRWERKSEDLSTAK